MDSFDNSAIAKGRYIQIDRLLGITVKPYVKGYSIHIQLLLAQSTPRPQFIHILYSHSKTLAGSQRGLCSMVTTINVLTVAPWHLGHKTPPPKSRLAAALVCPKYLHC